MSFDKKRFLDPPLALGALKILHDVVPSPTYGPADREAARAVYRRYKEIGYAGVVTNLPFDNGYLDGPGNWKVLDSLLEAADDEGMRLWLYDEKGYPSGAAGGKTLKENPAWEAKGIVCLTGYGERVDIPLPRGHWRFIAAYAYDGTSLDDIDYGSAVPVALGESVHYRGARRFVAAIALKPCFEMTHAAQNVFSIRRYIDVCDRDAVAAFIRNTHEAYFSHEKRFFGGRFEAIFTDEPSYMAPYIDNGNPRDPEAYKSGRGSRWNIPMEDRLDPDIPLYPTVHWTAAVEDTFDGRYYPALFGGDTPAARKARLTYHRAMSRLYGESYFGQIGAWCRAHGIAFSGHILLEDEIKYHPMFEGDFFEKLRHMDVPGIDILNAAPRNVWNLLLTPKLCASIARIGGKTRVMSESSAHTEKSQGVQVTLRERMCSTAMQYACGVTLINSYYGPEELTDEENTFFGRFVQRLTLLCEGGRPILSAALYYPIDSLFSDYLPSDQSIWTRPYPDAYRDTANFFQQAAIALLRQHTDYDILNTDALMACRVEDGALIGPGGGHYRALILPPLSAVPDGLTCKLREASESGVRLIAGAGRAGGDYEDLIARAEMAATGEDAAARAQRAARPVLRADAPWLIGAVMRFDDHDMVLLVNTEGERRRCAIELDLTGETYLLHPETGESELIGPVPDQMSFEPWETLALWISK